MAREGTEVVLWKILGVIFTHAKCTDSVHAYVLARNLAFRRNRDMKVAEFHVEIQKVWECNKFCENKHWSLEVGVS